MKHLLCVLILISWAAVGAAQGLSAPGQAKLLWKPFPELGGAERVYLLSPSCDAPTSRTRVEGIGFTVELWYAIGRSGEDLLTPLPFAQGVFTDEGYMNLRSSFAIPNTYGGDTVTLQFRAWGNRNDTVRSWDAALRDTSVSRGTSALIQDFRLSGLSREGLPIPGDVLFPHEFTICAVPEPSTLVLVACGVLGLVLSLSRDIVPRLV